MRLLRALAPTPLTAAFLASAGIHAAVLVAPALLDRGETPGPPLLRISLVEERGPEPPLPAVPRPDVPEGVSPGGRDGRPGDDAPISLDSADPRYRDYLGIVRRMIARSWDYPGEARERGMFGNVVLEFALARSGGLSGVRVAESSGSRLLDEAALEAVRAASPFPPCPAEIRRDPLTVSAMFVYAR